MKKLIILILFMTTNLTYSQMEWELAKEMKAFSHLEVESFSKDTFVVMAYFNSLRNENITFEWSVHLTTDRGNSWSRIYQDSIGIPDLPRRERRIFNLEVTENSVIAFTREDGNLVTSKDYGKTWDSLLIFLPYERGTLLTSYKEFLACYTNEDYIIKYNTITGDTNHINIPILDIDFGGDNVQLFERHLYMRNDDEYYFIYNSTTEKASYSYLHITKDGGATWKIRKNPFYYTDMVFLDDNIVYACGSVSLTATPYQGDFTGIIEKSTDGGYNWVNVVNAKDVADSYVFNYFLKIFVSKTRIMCNNEGYNSISSKKGEDNWQFDNLEPMTFVNSGQLNDIACDENDICLGAFSGNYIVRNVVGITSVEDDIKDLNLNYKYIEVYDLSGQKLYESKSEEENGLYDLTNGLYLKVYKDNYDNIVRTEKLIITK